MNPLTIVSALAALGGIVGAILAVFKLSPERQSIFITTAQGAVVVQAGVIDDLREGMEFLRQRIDTQEAEICSMRDKVTATKAERDALKRENDRLTARVATLETQVEGLKNGEGHS